MKLDKAAKDLIDATVRLAESLEWDISDSGYAGVYCDYDLAGELAERVDAYKAAAGIVDADGGERRKHQKAIAGLASLVRR